MEYLFSLLGDKELLTGQYCPICVLKVKVIPSLSVCLYHYVNLWHVLMFVCMPSWITYSWSVTRVAEQTS